MADDTTKASIKIEVVADQAVKAILELTKKIGTLSRHISSIDKNIKTASGAFKALPVTLLTVAAAITEASNALVVLSSKTSSASSASQKLKPALDAATLSLRKKEQAATQAAVAATLLAKKQEDARKAMESFVRGMRLPDISKLPVAETERLLRIFSETDDSTNALFKAIGKLGKGEYRMSIYTQVATSEWQKFRDVLKSTTSQVSPITSAAFSKLKTAISTMSPAFKPIENGIKSVVTSVRTFGKELTTNISTAALDKLKIVATTISPIFKTLGQGVQSTAASFRVLGKDISSIATNTATVAMEKLKSVINTASPVLNILGQSAKAVTAGLRSFGTTISSIVTPVISKINSIATTVRPVFQELSKLRTIGTSLGPVFKQFGAAISATVAAMRTFSSEMKTKVTNALDRLRQSIARTREQLKPLGEHFKTLGSISNHVFYSMRRGLGTFLVLQGVIFSLTFAIRGLAESFAGLAKRSVEVLNVRSAFDRVVQSVQNLDSSFRSAYGTTKSYLNAIQESTFGTMNMDEAARLATRAISEFGASISPKLPDVFKVASAASILWGKDVEDMVRAITQGSSRLYNTYFQQLGLIIDLDQEYKSYAEDVLHVSRELTRTEKSQAALNAVLRKGQMLVNALNQSHMSLAVSVASVKTRLTDFRDEILITLSPAFAVGAQIINEFVQTTTPKIEDWVRGILEYFAYVPDAVARGLSSMPALTEQATVSAYETMGNRAGDWIVDALTWGANVGSQFAIGILEGFTNVIVFVMNTISSILSSWLAPGSPPRVAPELDKWGEEAAAEYLRGFENYTPDFKNLLWNLKLQLQALPRQDLFEWGTQAIAKWAEGLSTFDLTLLEQKVETELDKATAVRDQLTDKLEGERKELFRIQLLNKDPAAIRAKINEVKATRAAQEAAEKEVKTLEKRQKAIKRQIELFRLLERIIDSIQMKEDSAAKGKGAGGGGGGAGDLVGGIGDAISDELAKLGSGAGGNLANVMAGIRKRLSEIFKDPLGDIETAWKTSIGRIEKAWGGLRTALDNAGVLAYLSDPEWANTFGKFAVYAGVVLITAKVFTILGTAVKFAYSLLAILAKIVVWIGKVVFGKILIPAIGKVVSWISIAIKFFAGLGSAAMGAIAIIAIGFVTLIYGIVKLITQIDKLNKENFPNLWKTVSLGDKIFIGLIESFLGFVVTIGDGLKYLIGFWEWVLNAVNDIVVVISDAYVGLAKLFGKEIEVPFGISIDPNTGERVAAFIQKELDLIKPSTLQVDDIFNTSAIQYEAALRRSERLLEDLRVGQRGWNTELYGTGTAAFHAGDQLLGFESKATSAFDTMSVETENAVRSVLGIGLAMDETNTIYSRSVEDILANLGEIPKKTTSIKEVTQNSFDAGIASVLGYGTELTNLSSVFDTTTSDIDADILALINSGASFDEIMDGMTLSAETTQEDIVLAMQQAMSGAGAAISDADIATLMAEPFDEAYENIDESLANSLALMEGFAADLPEQTEIALGDREGMYGKFKKYFGLAVDVTETALRDIERTTRTNMGKIKSQVSTELTAIKNNFQTTMSSIRTNTSTAFGDMVIIARQRMGEFRSAIQTELDLVRQRIEFDRQIWVGLGRSMVDGMVEGIRQYAYRLVVEIIKAVKAAKEAAENYLAASSPSKVFMEIGESTMDGFAIGVEDNAKRSRQAMLNALGLVLDSAMRMVQQDENYTILDILTEKVDAFIDRLATLKRWTDTHTIALGVQSNELSGMRSLATAGSSSGATIINVHGPLVGQLVVRNGRDAGKETVRSIATEMTRLASGRSTPS